ncbi:hypothetical protein DD237_007350 [Peronospora effusa]|uniref:Sodium/calcium exchanger membrane region domain-containing protein n=1 Tax=Peronospora effusa TaxID=542832 RepID=A0A425CET4_9STRA|nr:hypothetical protein DD237_007350 [Peronospora effusa]
MALQLRPRNIRRRVRQLAKVAVVMVGCTAGQMVMTYRVLSDPTSVFPNLVEAFPHPTPSWKTSSEIVLYIAALGYIFVSLAIVYDDYFVSTLENISQNVALSPDVAGANFMAASLSAPELSVSLVDNVFRKPAESMGVGIIMGLDLFNILIIISLSALRTGKSSSTRLAMIHVVLTFAVWDSSVDVPDSMIMVCSYTSCIGYMAFSGAGGGSKQEKKRKRLALASVLTSDATPTADVTVFKGDVSESIVTTEDVRKSMDEKGHLHTEHQCLGEQDVTMLGSQQHMFQAQQPLQHMVIID